MRDKLKREIRATRRLMNKAKANFLRTDEPEYFAQMDVLTDWLGRTYDANKKNF